MAYSVHRRAGDPSTHDDIQHENGINSRAPLVPNNSINQPNFNMSYGKVMDGQHNNAGASQHHEPEEEDDVDDYLRKIYLARKKRTQNRDGGVQPTATVTTEAAANCVATAKAASLKRNSHRNSATPGQTKAEEALFSSSFAAAAKLRKQQQLGDSSASNGSASRADPTAAERFRQVEEPLVDRDDVRKVGQIIRQARQRGSPEPEAEPGMCSGCG